MCVIVFPYSEYITFIVDLVQLWYYLPTPPLGQDKTQGQFLSGV